MIEQTLEALRTGFKTLMVICFVMFATILMLIGIIIYMLTN